MGISRFHLSLSLSLILNREKELISFCFSSHPLTENFDFGSICLMLDYTSAVLLLCLHRYRYHSIWSWNDWMNPFSIGRNFPIRIREKKNSQKGRERETCLDLISLSIGFCFFFNVRTNTANLRFEFFFSQSSFRYSNFFYSNFIFDIFMFCFLIKQQNTLNHTETNLMESD